MIQPSIFLSRALLADAIFSGVAAVALTLGAGVLAPFLNLPEALLRETGLFLIAYTALVGWLATRSTVAKALVLLVIVGNAAWTLGSIALLFSGAVSPNLLGQVFIVAQAIATGVFAELQYIGLRKSGERGSGVSSAVIASEAKQSSLARGEEMDCFVASLPCANASRLSQAMTGKDFSSTPPPRSFPRRSTQAR